MVEQEFGWRRKDSSAAPYTWSQEKRKTAPSRRPILKVVFPPAVEPAILPANKSYPSKRRGYFPKP